MEQKSLSRVGRPKGENVENTKRRRKQLIDAAVASIVEHGLSATTLATVANASGLSQSAAVFYFKSKESLLYETFRYRLEEYRNAWTTAVAAAGPDPVDRLVAMILASIDPPLLTPQNLAFWNSFWPEASRNRKLNEISERYDAEWQEVELSLCEEAKPFMAGDLWSPTILAHTLEALSDGVWSRMHYSPDYMAADDAVMAAATLLATVFPARAGRIMAKARQSINDSQEQR